MDCALPLIIARLSNQYYGRIEFLKIFLNVFKRVVTEHKLNIEALIKRVDFFLVL